MGGGFCAYDGSIAAVSGISEVDYLVMQNNEAGSDCDTGCGPALAPNKTSPRCSHTKSWKRSPTLKSVSRASLGLLIGNFVELKNTRMGKGAKANHLAYLGDSVIGTKANIGAGTITCNYDGVNKHQTTIGEHAFIGSNSTLVAPIEVGDRAYVGAGSVFDEAGAAGQPCDRPGASGSEARLEAEGGQEEMKRKEMNRNSGYPGILLAVTRVEGRHEQAPLINGRMQVARPNRIE